MTANPLAQRQARFWKQYMRLTRARLSNLQALEVIAREEQDPGFQETVRSLSTAMEQGIPLSETLVKHPLEFSVSVCSLIRSAENTGAWDEILLEIAEGLADGTFTHPGENLSRT